jgi:hypothetical protein
MSIKQTLILLSILAFLAGLVVFLRLSETGERIEEPPDIWSFNVESIEHISIVLPKRGKSIAFFREGKEIWHIDKDGTPVDPKRWGGIVLLVSGPRSRRVIAEKADDLAEYGIDDPRMVITLKIRGRRDPLRVLVGDHTPNDKSIYVKLENHPAVYLLDHTWNDTLERLVMEPPEKRTRSVLKSKGGE